MKAKLDVGGQAVIEGVMMRSPRSFAVVCRRPNGSIVIKEDAWRPLWRNVRFLRWPLLRGTIVLIESLLNGFSALSFAARQQAIEGDETAPPARSLGAAASKPSEPGRLAQWGMLAISIAFGLALFVGAPHLLSWALGGVVGYDTTSFAFHIVDGVIKVAILLAYLATISLLPDIKRVFQYHGAEHKAIFTYERGQPLTVENARKQSRFHPRCGTSFLLIVVMVSIVIFAAVLRGEILESSKLDHLVKIFLKIPLMLPVAGLSYELLKLAGRKCDTSALARALSAPGMWLQRITTREPSDEQLEIALLSIRKTLWRERRAETTGTAPGGEIEVYRSAAEVDLPFA